MPTDQAFLDGLTCIPFTNRLDLSRFRCNETIDEFLVKCAGEFQDKRLSAVTCWMHGDDLAGYITTSMETLTIREASVRAGLGLNNLKTTKHGKDITHFPACLIGMLGTCERYSGKGLGLYMVNFAIGLGYSLSKQIGCRAVTVDSDNTEEARSLYRKAKFQEVANQEKKKETTDQEKKKETIKMYYDLGAIRPADAVAAE